MHSLAEICHLVFFGVCRTKATFMRNFWMKYFTYSYQYNPFFRFLCSHFYIDIYTIPLCLNMSPENGTETVRIHQYLMKRKIAKKHVKIWEIMRLSKVFELISISHALLIYPSPSVNFGAVVRASKRLRKHPSRGERRGERVTLPVQFVPFPEKPALH